MSAVWSVSQAGASGVVPLPFCRRNFLVADAFPGSFRHGGAYAGSP